VTGDTIEYELARAAAVHATIGALWLLLFDRGNLHNHITIDNRYPWGSASALVIEEVYTFNRTGVTVSVFA